jgi:DNA-binding transcriptional LysR family regulator
MNDRLQQLALFVRTVETGSFSRAAREFGLTQPSVSRAVAALEERLGVKLIARTTRELSATEAGEALLARARDALAALEDAENAARGADRLSGVLRVALPTTYGARRIAPLLPAFLDQHPRLKIDLMMSDRYENLIAEGAELALRVGQQPDSSFVARKLESARRLFIAAPSYLARRDAPKSLADLAEHDVIGGGPAAPGEHSWAARRNGTARDRAGRASSARALGGWRRRLRFSRPRRRRRVDMDVRGGACVGRAHGSAGRLRARSDRRLHRVPRGPAALTEGAHLRQLS